MAGSQANSQPISRRAPLSGDVRGNSPLLSRRASAGTFLAGSWEEIWEAGPYYQRISELLETAENYAVFVGWQIDSRLPMGSPPEHLKEKIVRLCEQKPGFQVYFLMWDHAYFYVLERETWQGRIWDDVHPRVHFVFDNRHPFGGSHHEKVVIIDGKTAFCGGIDLCDERWDSPAHFYYDPRRSLSWKSEHHGPYHDLAVQVTGPVCAEIQRHIARRWRTLSSIPFPEPPPAYLHGEGHSVLVSRTISSIDAEIPGSFSGSARTPIVREIEHLFKELIAQAEKRIILEGQYFWSTELTDALIAAIRRKRGQDFTVVIVLAELGKLKSLTRMMAGHQLRLLKRLQLAARDSGTRLVLGTPYILPDRPAADGAQPPLLSKAQPKPVYIHSKVVVVDDNWAAIGSANFASRALRLDTELMLTLEARTEAERAHVRRLAATILGHWSIDAETVPLLSGEPERHPDPHVRLVQYAPQYELLELATSRRFGFFGLLASWTTWIPWDQFFDPIVPWLYPLKRRFRKLVRRERAAATLSLSLVWLGGTIASLAVAGALAANPLGPSADRWETAFAAVLSSTWILRVPFVALAMLGVIHWSCEFGTAPEMPIRIAIGSFWVASAIGYALTRMFPTPFSALFRRSGPKWLPERLGLRRFPSLLSVLLDPRVGIRSKIAYQGLYCVPLPWVLVGNGLILPSVLDGLLHLTAWAAARNPSEDARALAASLIPWFFGVAFAVCLSSLLRSSRKR